LISSNTVWTLPSTCVTPGAGRDLKGDYRPGRRSMEVIVPDDQLSLAIGKRGQNVRLGSKLTGWHIDVKSEAKYQKSLREGYQSLLALPGIGEATADHLYEAGSPPLRNSRAPRSRNSRPSRESVSRRLRTSSSCKDYLTARQMLVRGGPRGGGGRGTGPRAGMSDGRLHHVPERSCVRVAENVPSTNLFVSLWTARVRCGGP